MPDAVRKNDKVASRIERLARTEQDACKLRLEKLMPGAACSVKDEHGVGGTPMRVLNRFAKRGVVQPQFRQRLAGMKLEIVNYKIAFRCCWDGRLLRGTGRGHQ